MKIEIEKQLDSRKGMVYIFCAALFFLGYINTFNMVLAYMGVGEIRSVISTLLFVLMDLAIGVYFLFRIRKERCNGALLAAALAAALYGVPYIVTGNGYVMMQYICFILPVFLAAYLIVFDHKGGENFFNAFSRLSVVAILGAVVYILFLFLVKPDKSGVVAVKGMTYGNIAYVFIPFLFVSFWNFIDKMENKELIGIIPYTAAIIYTGLRSAFVCMFFVLASYLFCAAWTKRISRERVLRMIALLLVILICRQVCVWFMPESSRLNVTYDGFVKEITEQNQLEAGGGPDTGDKGNQDKVRNVDTGEYQPMNKVYMHYLAKFDSDRYTTEKILHEDIVKGSGRYIEVSESQYEWASKYELPMNRIVLWGTAWQEFKKSPIFGNGIYYYHSKYVDYFPHNVVFEILADYGLVGLSIIAFGVLYLLFRLLAYMRRTSDDEFLGPIVFALGYIPMHLLYSSLYFNMILIYTVILLVLIEIKHRHKRKEGNRR